MLYSCGYKGFVQLYSLYLNFSYTTLTVKRKKRKINIHDEKEIIPESTDLKGNHYHLWGLIICTVFITALLSSTMDKRTWKWQNIR